MPDQSSSGELQSGVNLAFNLSFHAAALFGVLLLAYWMFIKNVAHAELQKQLNAALEEHLHAALVQANVQSNGNFKRDLQPIRAPLETLERMYQGPDPDDVDHNQQVLILGITIFLGLSALFIALVLGAKVAGYQVARPVLGTLMVGLAGILAVAGVEVAWFLLISKKYVPAKPSTLVTTVLNSAKKAV